MPLAVIQHGTERRGPQYRDAFAQFAEQYRCLILAPLFPAGIADPDDLHNFKFIQYRDIRFDLVLLDMVREVAEQYHVDSERFLLHGFSGGGQFAHRFFYLHPDRLAGVSIERLITLRDNFAAYGIDVRFDVVPGVAHEPMRVLDKVQDFFGAVLTGGTVSGT